MQKPGLNIAEYLGKAKQCFKKGNLPQTEILCRIVLSASKNQADALHLLDRVTQNLAVSSSAGGFLLIKAWGYGFWSDIGHVLGQLLLSEITGRTPVIHWGSNSLFRDRGADNAFDVFFEPVSPYSIHDIRELASSWYPPKWSAENILDDEVNKWEGEHSRIAGLLCLFRGERVVVSDFYTSVLDLMPWIPAGHRLQGKTLYELHRFLMQKYLRPRAQSILARVDEFWRTNLQGAQVMGVHARGTDKVAEAFRLDEVNAAYKNTIDAHCEKQAVDAIFLITDDEDIQQSFERWYGGRLIHTQVTRSRGETGVHYQACASPEQLGIEVAVDTYLASRCHYFLGNGSSNVSSAVAHLAEWAHGDCNLFGECCWYQHNIFLHNRV